MMKHNPVHIYQEGCKCFVVSKEISGEAKDIGRVWSLIARRKGYYNS